MNQTASEELVEVNSIPGIKFCFECYRPPQYSLHSAKFPIFYIWSGVPKSIYYLWANALRLRAKRLTLTTASVRLATGLLFSISTVSERFGFWHFSLSNQSSIISLWPTPDDFTRQGIMSWHERVQCSLTLTTQHSAVLWLMTALKQVFSVDFGSVG